MVKDVFTVLVGGKAGEGVKKAGAVASSLFSSMGKRVFQRDDYMSLIQGGHNYTVTSTANREVNSHYLTCELIINSDERSYNKHKDKLAENGLLIYNSDKIGDADGFGVPFSSLAKDHEDKDRKFSIGAVTVFASSIGLNLEETKDLIKSEYPKTGIEDNLAYASEVFEVVNPDIGGRFKVDEGDKKLPIINGNQSLSMGAIMGGLDCYYAYPMTPASSILHFMAKNQKRFNLAVGQPENEIAVMNMAIGSAFTGARTMVGSSGGGFALMTEAYSLAGMCEAPVLAVLSSRPGPASGVPTYTEQADLQYALNVGHGDFPRIVASPGSITEAFRLSAELLDMAWKFQGPVILLTSKHLSESWMTVDLDPDVCPWAEPKSYDDVESHENGEYLRYKYTDDGISPLKFIPSEELVKWNSYEHDELGITTEEPEIVKKMHDKRHQKLDTIKTFMKNLKTVNVYGDEGPLIFTWGSTTMSVLEAVQYGDIEARVVQPLYLRPFPVWEMELFKNQEVITVELNKSGQFTKLVQEKAGINVKKLINKYDSRPFEPTELAQKLKEVL